MAAAALSMSACNTVSGFGEDLQNAGESLENAAERSRANASGAQKRPPCPATRSDDDELLGGPTC